MIGGALLGLLMPKRFGKLGGFSIVGLSFANLVMTAVEDTASLFFINKANNSEPYTQAELWLGTFSGIIAMIAIICLIFALAFPKAAKVLGPAAAIAFAITGLMDCFHSLGFFSRKCNKQICFLSFSYIPLDK